MKKLVFLTVFGFAGTVSADSQAQVSLNVNIGAQPQWGPVGYDHVSYYYLPDIETYYYVPKRQFIHRDKGRWIYSSALPSRYAGYDLYSGYKVIVNSPNAYHHFDTHRVKYAGYKGNRSQHFIGRDHNRKYYVVKQHPKFKEHKGGKHHHKRRH